MKHFLALLFCSMVAAQVSTDFKINGTGATAGKNLQRFSGTTHQIFDTDASKPMIDLVGGATSGEIWTRKESALFPTLAPRAAGISGDTVFGQRFMLGSDPSGFNFRGFEVPSGATGEVIWKLPVSDAAGCLQSDGSLNLSIGTCGGVTLNTAQTGAAGITASKSFWGSGVELDGYSGGLKVWSITQAGQAVLALRDTSGTNTLVRIEGGATQGEVATYTENVFGTSSKTAALSGASIFGSQLLLGSDLSGFTFRGFSMPAGAFGSVIWKLPASDANGCLKSDGATNLSISSCGGGVTSVSGAGLISVASGTTTPVISCPNCANTNSGNFFNGLNVFNGTLRLTSGSETLFPVSTNVYDLGTSARRWNTLYVGGINTAGFAGIGLVCFGGTYLTNPTFTNGILTAGSCAF